MNMPKKYFLSYWPAEKACYVLSEDEIRNMQRGTNQVDPKEFFEGISFKVNWDGKGKTCVGKVLHMGYDKDYLDSIAVATDGTILEHPKKRVSDRKNREKLSLKRKQCKEGRDRREVSDDLEVDLLNTQEPLEATSRPCTGKCGSCCTFRKVWGLLPQMNPDLLQGLQQVLKFIDAAQTVVTARDQAKENFTEPVSIAQWQLPGREKVEIGSKGSGVWLPLQDLVTAKSVSRNTKKCPEKALFRKLLALSLGNDGLQQMVAQRDGASKVPINLFGAIESEVNNEFFKKMDSKPGRAYYIRTVNVYFSYLRNGSGHCNTKAEVVNGNMDVENVAGEDNHKGNSNHLKEEPKKKKKKTNKRREKRKDNEEEKEKQDKEEDISKGAESLSPHVSPSSSRTLIDSPVTTETLAASEPKPHEQSLFLNYSEIEKNVNLQFLARHNIANQPVSQLSGYYSETSSGSQVSLPVLNFTQIEDIPIEYVN